MTSFQFFGALQIGLIYGIVGIGVYLTFRTLDFPDLTVDGSFSMGAAVTAILILQGYSAWLSLMIAFFAGCLAGMTTAYLNVRWKILHLLASILTMTALYSINLRIMERPNASIQTNKTVFASFESLLNLKSLVSPMYTTLPLLILSVSALVVILWRLMISEIGLSLRATGSNPRMAIAQGIHTNKMIVFGVGLSNGLVALAGALFAQSQGFADIGFGQGTIIAALASVIIGEVILPKHKIWLSLTACVLGSICYRLLMALALNTKFFGLQASDLSLITALLVGVFMIMPRLKVHIYHLITQKNRHA